MRVEDAEDLQKKIMSAKYDFNDFLKQTKAIAQMGSMSRIMGMIPGMGKVCFFVCFHLHADVLFSLWFRNRSKMVGDFINCILAFHGNRLLLHKFVRLRRA